jgi:prepilin-type N-terminal cleavage/methylation domain-containing protein
VTSVARRRGRGFTLFELVVVVAVIAILAAVLLRYLIEYTERAEKAAMEQVAGTLSAALHLRIAGLLASGADQDIAKLAEQNPMDWLSDKPGTYVGPQYGVAAIELAPRGSWYYDTKAKQLVYRPLRVRHLESPREGERDIRYKVWIEQGVLPGGEHLAAPLRGIRRAEFAPVTPYRWFVPEN